MIKIEASFDEKFLANQTELNTIYGAITVRVDDQYDKAIIDDSLSFFEIFFRDFTKLITGEAIYFSALDYVGAACLQPIGTKFRVIATADIGWIELKERIMPKINRIGYFYYDRAKNKLMPQTPGNFRTPDINVVEVSKNELIVAVFGAADEFVKKILAINPGLEKSEHMREFRISLHNARQLWKRGENPVANGKDRLRIGLMLLNKKPDGLLHLFEPFLDEANKLFSGNTVEFRAPDYFGGLYLVPVGEDGLKIIQTVDEDDILEKLGTEKLLDLLKRKVGNYYFDAHKGAFIEQTSENTGKFPAVRITKATMDRFVKKIFEETKNFIAASPRRPNQISKKLWKAEAAWKQRLNP